MPLDKLKVRPSLYEKVRGVAILAVGFGSLLPFNVIQLSSLALRPFSRRAFRAMNRWCADSWWGLCVVGAERLNGSHVVFTGDNVPMRENALLVANHQEMPDITAIMKFCKTKDRLGDMKYFVKKQLKWVPGMGWGMQFLDCVFIDRDWTADRDRIQQTFSRLVDGRVPVHLVSFVEGTRLTLPKLAKAQQFARDKGLYVPRHLLVPRSKGFSASVEGLRQHVTAVYDITIGYEHGVPNLWQYITGLVERIHVHVRRFPIDELPETQEKLRQWLLDRWQEKDALMERFYSNGAFPDSPVSASE